jgi:hypothetical protein
MFLACCSRTFLTFTACQSLSLNTSTYVLLGEIMQLESLMSSDTIASDTASVRLSQCADQQSHYWSDHLRDDRHQAPCKMCIATHTNAKAHSHTLLVHCVHAHLCMCTWHALILQHEQSASPYHHNSGPMSGQPCMPAQPCMQVRSRQEQQHGSS